MNDALARELVDVMRGLTLELQALRGAIAAARPPRAVNEAPDLDEWLRALLPDLRAMAWFTAKSAIARVPRLADEFPGKTGSMALGRRLAGCMRIVVDGHTVIRRDERGAGVYRTVRALPAQVRNVHIAGTADFSDKGPHA